VPAYQHYGGPLTERAPVYAGRTRPRISWRLGPDASRHNGRGYRPLPTYPDYMAGRDGLAFGCHSQKQHRRKKQPAPLYATAAHRRLPPPRNSPGRCPLLQPGASRASQFASSMPPLAHRRDAGVLPATLPARMDLSWTAFAVVVVRAGATRRCDARGVSPHTRLPTPSTPARLPLPHLWRLHPWTGAGICLQRKISGAYSVCWRATTLMRYFTVTTLPCYHTLPGCARHLSRMPASRLPRWRYHHLP